MMEVQQIFMSRYNDTPEGCISIKDSSFFDELRKLIKEDTEHKLEQHYMLYDVVNKQIAKVVNVDKFDLESVLGCVVTLADANGDAIYSNMFITKCQLTQDDGLLITSEPEKALEVKEVSSGNSKRGLRSKFFNKRSK